MTGCSAPGRGPTQPAVDLDGQSYTVGGKEFIEQQVLCKMTILALESAHASVSDRCTTTGTDVVRQQLVSGEISMYWEYTGTGWSNHLKLPNPPSDPDALYRGVAEKDLQNNVVWLPRSQVNDTYTFATDDQTARRMNIQTFTDMGRVVSSAGDQSTVCMETEFRMRPDGWLPMQNLYGFTVPDDRVPIKLVDDIYPQVGAGKQCTFGEVYSTDGRVAQLGLVTLRDDKRFLPNYNAALTIRRDIFQAHPEIAKLVQPITTALNNQVMLELDARVADGDDPEDVARDWLRQIRFIE